MKTVCIIPARMASSRFPGKPLAPLLGLALVLHVHDRCRLTEGLERVVVATCDDEIRAAVEAHGGEAVMTSDTHPGCVDRTEEAIANLQLGLTDDDLVLMVQGDEVMVTPQMNADIIEAYAADGGPVVNLASRLQDAADLDDPNTVKVVADPGGRALYFSRAAIPSRARGETAPAYQQTGIIAFSHAFLHRFGRLAQTPLEKLERIDMLRVLEHGLNVRMVFTEQETVGVDTPADLKRAEEMLRREPLTRRYMDVAV